ncbi:L,D-transpeptidase [Marinobacterium sp. MBR-109]|jgi:lipoprotein-anchoring transpeptidase ErfK/SrfK|uniref:L,D-transpeptidase n=1 Tax=Marinobacterium sp. MBR-109 TaxID=3156462 RepID=UPI00339B3422
MQVWLQVSLKRQQLVVHTEKGAHSYPVSTAKAGAGERNGSGCTPRGRHYIRACIGSGQPAGAVFVGRRPTGEVYSDRLAASHPERDWILTRILWLCGREPGFNRGGAVDTQRRYIYIHGTPDTEPMGTPLSHGCIRMRNTDLLELFEQVSPGTDILIEE